MKVKGALIARPPVVRILKSAHNGVGVGDEGQGRCVTAPPPPTAQQAVTRAPPACSLLALLFIHPMVVAMVVVVVAAWMVVLGMVVLGMVVVGMTVGIVGTEEVSVLLLFRLLPPGVGPGHTGDWLSK